jgi:hypothetical protein
MSARNVSKANQNLLNHIHQENIKNERKGSLMYNFPYPVP